MLLTTEGNMQADLNFYLCVFKISEDFTMKKMILTAMAATIPFVMVLPAFAADTPASPAPTAKTQTEAPAPAAKTEKKKATKKHSKKAKKAAKKVSLKKAKKVSLKKSNKIVASKPIKKLSKKVHKA